MHDNGQNTPETSPAAAAIGLLILRIGVEHGDDTSRAPSKAFDFEHHISFHRVQGQVDLPTIGALMVTVAETAAGSRWSSASSTPLAACAVIGAMMWRPDHQRLGRRLFPSQHLNMPFLLFIGVTTLLFTGAGAYSIDAGCFGRLADSPPKIAVGLLVPTSLVAEQRDLNCSC